MEKIEGISAVHFPIRFALNNQHRTPQPEWHRFHHASLLKPFSSDNLPLVCTNLIDHLNRRHSSQVVAQAYEDHIDGIRRQSPFVDVSPEALNIFRWVGRSREPRAAILRERIGEKEHKLGSSVEQDVAGLEISSHVRDAIATAIAGSVVQLVPDAWTDGNWHYLGISAVVPDPRHADCRKTYLLSFAPILKNDFSIRSTSMRISWLFWSVNLAQAKKIELPLVGFASHRLHVAAKIHLRQYDQVVSTVTTLVKLLRTPKKRNVLRQHDIIIPCLRNETRWSSTLEMLRTYAFIQPQLDAQPSGEPSDEEELIDFESKGDGVTLHQVRILFGSLIKSYPESCRRHFAGGRLRSASTTVLALLERPITWQTETMTVSTDLRWRAIVLTYIYGIEARDVGRVLGVSVRSIVRWNRLFQQNGNVLPKQYTRTTSRCPPECIHFV
ncbi:TPA: LOW QUALITY PROTEIN: hypothetical protein N0F65_006152, partial [Lagenidium giganteum]